MKKTSIFHQHLMTALPMDAPREKERITGFNNALELADAKVSPALESCQHALRRAELELDAIVGGRNKAFVCAPVILDYCRAALNELQALRS